MSDLVVPVGFVVFLAVFVAVGFFIERYRRELIREEADAKGTVVKRIRRYWQFGFSGPFDYEWYRRGTTFYVVTCTVDDGAERVAYAAVGPRRGDWFDVYGTLLTWRWADEPRKIDSIDRNLAIIGTVVGLLALLTLIYLRFFK